jgi:hypothetical protein
VINRFKRLFKFNLRRCTAVVPAAALWGKVGRALQVASIKPSFLELNATR